MHCQYTSSSNLGSTVQLILTYCHWRLMYYHISLPYAHMWGHVPDCPSLSFSDKAPQGKLRILSRLAAMLLPRSSPRTSPGWRWCRPSSRHCAGRTRRGPRGTSGRERSRERYTGTMLYIVYIYAVSLCSILQCAVSLCSVRLLVCSAQQRVSTAPSSRALQHKQLIGSARPGPGCCIQLCGAARRSLYLNITRILSWQKTLQFDDCR